MQFKQQKIVISSKFISIYSDEKSQNIEQLHNTHDKFHIKDTS
jgi:hypothetical protein